MKRKRQSDKPRASGRMKQAVLTSGDSSVVCSKKQTENAANGNAEFLDFQSRIFRRKTVQLAEFLNSEHSAIFEEMQARRQRGVGPVGRPPNSARSTFLTVSEFFYFDTRLAFHSRC